MNDPEGSRCLCHFNVPVRAAPVPKDGKNAKHLFRYAGTGRAKGGQIRADRGEHSSFCAWFSLRRRRGLHRAPTARHNSRHVASFIYALLRSLKRSFCPSSMAQSTKRPLETTTGRMPKLCPLRDRSCKNAFVFCRSAGIPPAFQGKTSATPLRPQQESQAYEIFPPQRSPDARPQHFCSG